MPGIEAQLQHCLLLEASLNPLSQTAPLSYETLQRMISTSLQHSTHSPPCFVIKHTFNR